MRLTFRFASDFADLFEVRGERRAARGDSSAALRERSQRGACATWVSTTSSASPSSLSIPRRKPDHRACRIRIDAQAARNAPHLRALRSAERRRRRLERPLVLPADARRAACPARIERARRQHRQLQFRVQRNRAPLGLGSCTCWSPTRRKDPTPTPARPGSARLSGATASLPRS